jgi:hypothetical protein
MQWSRVDGNQDCGEKLQIHIRVGRADRNENFSRHSHQNLFNWHPFRSSIRSLDTPYTHSP